MTDGYDARGASSERRVMSIRNAAAVGVMAALICAVGPVALPIGPVPISLATLMIYMSIYLLGMKRGALSCAIYILLGAAGLPIFSGYAGGIAKLLGPTGGYIAGYIPMALIAGYAIDRDRRRVVQLAAMTAGTLVLYALGTIWFSAQSGMTIGASLSICVIPFIPGDIVKMLAASKLGPMIRERISAATR